MEINLGNTVPLFAHDVAMSNITKSEKSKEGKVRKESFTELIFIDSVRKCAIARIVLPQSTLEQLPQMIEDNTKKLRKDMRNKEMPKEKDKPDKKNDSYLG
jgi:hypothetical protein